MGLLASDVVECSVVSALANGPSGASGGILSITAQPADGGVVHLAAQAKLGSFNDRKLSNAARTRLDAYCRNRQTISRA